VGEIEVADKRDTWVERLRLHSRGRRGVVGLWLVAILFLLAVPGSEVSSGPTFTIAQQDSFRRVPVVMVVFDEFPVVSIMDETGAIDDGLFPNLARLSRDAIWYRNTATTAVFSHEALPAIFTGKLPRRGEMMTDIHPRNLFTLLGDAYKIRTYKPLPGFCPKRFCDLDRPPASEGELGRRFHAFGKGERGTYFGSFLDLIGREQPRRRPRFYFTHIAYPHVPWRYLPSGQRYEEDRPPGEVDIPGPGKAWSEDEWLTTQVWQRHLMQAANADRLVGALTHRLRTQGIYDAALVVIAADHGVAFEPGHPKRRIDPATLGHVGSVPLFIKAPHQRRGWISDAPLRVTDILPTIADILDLSQVWTGLDGRSAIGRGIPLDRRRDIDGYRVDPAGSEKFDVLAGKFELFGTSNGSLDLYAIAPPHTRRLLGRSTEDLHPFMPGDELVILDDAELEATDPGAPMFPALLEGSVQADGARELVAITVDGVVRAVTRTYHQDGETRFYAMLDPRDFGDVPHDVGAFVVERP
jgi:hypothetical protein